MGQGGAGWCREKLVGAGGAGWCRGKLVGAGEARWCCLGLGGARWAGWGWVGVGALLRYTQQWYMHRPESETTQQLSPTCMLKFSHYHIA